VDLTRLAIEKNRVTAALLLIVLFGGLIAFQTLPRAEDPGFVIRTAQVITSFPGASPERVEDLVTDRLERAIREIPELESVTSTSKTGISIIIVNIEEKYTDMRPIWDALRRKVERETPNLPPGAQEPIVNDEFGDVFGIVLALTGDGFSYAELKEVADTTRDEFLRLPDVAKVDILGVQDERIFIEYENARLAELELAPTRLSNILDSQNIVTPGGSIRLGPERIVIEPSGSFESLEDVQRAIFQLPDTQEVLYLEDIVEIRRDYIDPPVERVHTGHGAVLFHADEPSFPVKSPKTAALVLAVSMREGGRLTELGKQVNELTRLFNEVYPIGLQLDPIVFQPHDVQDVIDSFVSNLIQAVVVVMGAMLVFLGLRTGLVISALIPTTMMTTLLVMNVSGIGLDQISLAALIIALGMLVDNGVVMAESIVVGMSGGMTGKEAAIQSSRELRIPLLTASLTTSAAFLPIFLAESATGEYTAALFTVVTIALLASWLLSLTMTPMLCATFLHVDRSPQESAFDSAIYRNYRRLLEGLLHRRWLTLACVVLVFVATMSIARFIPALFFPSSDRPSFEVEIELPPGTDIEYTRHVVQDLEGFLVDELMVRDGRDSGILDWGSFIGRGGPRYYLSYGPEPSNPAYAILLVSTTSHEARDDAIGRIRSYFWENHPEVLANVHPRRLGPPVSHPVQIRLIAGSDAGSLFSIVDEVKARLRQISTTRNVGDDWGLRTRKIIITVDQARASAVGATSKDVALSLKTLFTGLDVTQYREGEKVIPVTMRSEEEGRLNFDVLTAANIYVESTGSAIPLSQIASGQIVWEPSKVLRRNGSRAVSVIADVAPGTLASDVINELVPWLEQASSSWPLGTRFEIGGEDEASSKANASIGAKLPLGAGIIVLLLVMQFNSFRKPAIVLLTVPLGLIGVVLGLLIAQSYFGFMTFLGVISLFGIVINNAIVLLDRIQLEIDENGRSPADAILVAAQARLRPILLTTGTTILGLVPLYLGGGPMWEPMAIAIMSGLAFATVLTLGVVPVLYSAFYRVRFLRAERP
jgi:multidrug efflux pump subunit AcrB